MKIAFVIINANRREGTSRAVLEVAERLVEHHQVDLWARTYDEPHFRGLCFREVRGPARPEVADFASFRWIVDRQLRQSEYDIIHSAGMNTNLADVYTVQTVQREKIARVKSERAKSKVSVIRRACWKAYDVAVMRAEDSIYREFGPRGQRHFLPVSGGTKKELLHWYPGVSGISDSGEIEGKKVAEALPANVHVIPNGADLAIFNPSQRPKFRNSIRSRHGIAEQDFLILFSGGDWRRKGLDLALKAMALIHDPAVKLLVVGHDRAGSDVRAMCSEMGLDSRVVFVGFQSNVEQYYASADLFLFPTTYEAFSLASIEAAASGLPVLMTEVSGAHELVGAGCTGTIITRDPDQIAVAIMRYRNSPDLVNAHGIAARKLVEEKFNWDVITTQTLEVYERIIRIRNATDLK